MSSPADESTFLSKRPNRCQRRLRNGVVINDATRADIFFCPWINSTDYESDSNRCILSPFLPPTWVETSPICVGSHDRPTDPHLAHFLPLRVLLLPRHNDLNTPENRDTFREGGERMRRGEKGGQKNQLVVCTWSSSRSDKAHTYTKRGRKRLARLLQPFKTDWLAFILMSNVFPTWQVFLPFDFRSLFIVSPPPPPRTYVLPYAFPPPLAGTTMRNIIVTKPRGERGIYWRRGNRHFTFHVYSNTPAYQFRPPNNRDTHWLNAQLTLEYFSPFNLRKGLKKRGKGNHPP